MHVLPIGLVVSFFRALCCQCCWHITPASLHFQPQAMSSSGWLEWNFPSSSMGTHLKHQQPSSSFSGEDCHSAILPQQKMSRHFGPTFQQLVGELSTLIKSNYEHATSNGAAFDKIQTILKQLKQFYMMEESQSKKQTALQILENASEILCHLFSLRNGYVSEHSLTHNQHVERTLKALKQTTSISHDQYVGPVKAIENRKMQVMFCFIESITGLLVHDIDTFGLNVNAYEKCGKMRREIANALMNVVYQQREAKLRLCSNLTFLRRVADIVANVPCLDQYYAGLIQNVSYNADRKSPFPFAHHLAITVPPMVRVVTAIMSDSDGQYNTVAMTRLEPAQKQRLYKLFSALWNLAESPIENKRVMCLDFPTFVPTLLHIMRSDPHEVSLIQAAIGIFKHLSTFIIQYPELFSKTLASGAICALLRQLYSFSADLIVDALLALSTLCRHPYAAHELLCQNNCLENIQCLTKNTNEGLVRAARSLLDTVNSVYYQVVPLQNGMFKSMVGWNCASTSIEANNHQLGLHFPGGGVNTAANYNTLPRATQQNFSKIQKGHNVMKNSLETPKGVLSSQNFHQDTEQRGQDAITQTQLAQLKPEESREQLVLYRNEARDGKEAPSEEMGECAFVTEPLIEAGQNLPTSVQCTRAASPQSSRSVDGVVNGEEWPSARSTSFNSRRSSGTDSSASPSDLPDSPSQCIAHKPFQLEAMALLIKKALEEEDEESKDANEMDQIEGNRPQMATGQKGACANAQRHKRSKRVSEEFGRSKDDDKSEDTTSGGTVAGESATTTNRDDDVNNNKNTTKVSNSFLDEVIRNYMPKPSAPTQCLATENAHFALTTTPISSNSPSKSPIRNKEKGGEPKQSNVASVENGRLLEESIASMMPHPNRKEMGNAHPKLLLNLPTVETFMAQQKGSADNELPADVNAEFDAQWMVVECGGGTAETSLKVDDVEKNLFTLKKTHSQSSIPRPSVALYERNSKTTTADLNATFTNSFLKRPTARSSTRTKKAPPPLAPKPNIAKLTKASNCAPSVRESVPGERGGQQ